jgi:hypothetical protein
LTDPHCAICAYGEWARADEYLARFLRAIFASVLGVVLIGQLPVVLAEEVEQPFIQNSFLGIGNFPSDI